MFMGVRIQEQLCIFQKSKLAKKQPEVVSPMETILAGPLSRIKAYRHYHFCISPDYPESVIPPVIFALDRTKKKGIQQKLCRTVSRNYAPQINHKVNQENITLILSECNLKLVSNLTFSPFRNTYDLLLVAQKFRRKVNPQFVQKMTFEPLIDFKQDRCAS